MIKNNTQAEKGSRMSPGNKANQKKQNPVGGLLAVGIIAACAVVLFILYPENTKPSLEASYTFFIDLVSVLPGVMILMGLFTVWIKKEMVIKYLGQSSGIKGFFLAFFLGMIPTGPLYVAFPLAETLTKKGARTATIVIFLSSWACIKLPQELVELRFMGVGFMALRLVLSFTLVFVMGLVIEKLSPDKAD